MNLIVPFRVQQPVKRPRSACASTGRNPNHPSDIAYGNRTRTVISVLTRSTRETTSTATATATFSVRSIAGANITASTPLERKADRWKHPLRPEVHVPTGTHTHATGLSGSWSKAGATSHISPLEGRPNLSPARRHLRILLFTHEVNRGSADVAVRGKLPHFMHPRHGDRREVEGSCVGY